MASALHDLATRIEQDEALDGPVAVLDRLVPDSFRTGERRALLGGRWLGHALHPMLTDFPLGMWMSASLLDVVGGSSSRKASRRLIGIGVAAAVPTALTGASDWTQATPPERRVGIVHAAANTVGLTCYTLSYLARRRGKHARGVLLGLAGGLAATAGGFFGGHLSMARDTGLRATESALRS